MNSIITKLSLKEKIGYGLGDTASHFVWDMVGFWLLFFYTDIYGISAAAAGTIMLIARFWDMAIDPVIGVVSDRTNTRWGKFRPYILFGAVPYAVLVGVNAAERRPVSLAQMTRSIRSSWFPISIYQQPTPNRPDAG